MAHAFPGRTDSAAQVVSESSSPTPHRRMHVGVLACMHTHTLCSSRLPVRLPGLVQDSRDGEEAKLGRHRQLKVPDGGGSALQLGVAQRRIQVGDLAPLLFSGIVLYQQQKQVSEADTEEWNCQVPEHP